MYHVTYTNNKSIEWTATTLDSLCMTLSLKDQAMQQTLKDMYVSLAVMAACVGVSSLITYFVW